MTMTATISRMTDADRRTAMIVNTVARVALASTDTLHTELVRMVLEESDVALDVVESHDDLVTELVASHPEILILDWDANGFDNRALLRALRNDTEHAALPVIVMVDRPVTGSFREELSQAGVRWILQKPIVASSLPKLVMLTILECRKRSLANSSAARWIDCGTTATGVTWEAIA